MGGGIEWKNSFEIRIYFQSFIIFNFYLEIKVLQTSFIANQGDL